MKRTAIVLLLVSASVTVSQQQRVLLAVFAHPDDETFAGPVLARHAREGVKVYLAIATKGEKGADERAPFLPEWRWQRPAARKPSVPARNLASNLPSFST